MKFVPKPHLSLSYVENAKDIPLGFSDGHERYFLPVKDGNATIDQT